MFYYVKVLTSEASGEEKQDEVELVTFRINYMPQSHTQTQVKASENIVGKNTVHHVHTSQLYVDR